MRQGGGAALPCLTGLGPVRHTSLELQSQKLFSLPSLSRAATIPIDATFQSFLFHALTDLDNDAPNVAIHSMTRLLLYPVDPYDLRKDLTPILSHRAASLKAGNASALWTAFD